MSLNAACLNLRGLRYLSKCACLLDELSNLCVDVTEVQEIQFICAADCQVLENDFVVLKAFGSRCRAGVSMLALTRLLILFL